MEYILYISNIYGIYNKYIKRNIMQLYKVIRKHIMHIHMSLEYTCAKMCIYIQIFMFK